MMKALILGLALVAPLAMASDKEFCDSFADSVFTIATQRDNGISRREMRHIIITKVDSELHEMFLLATEFVYERPFYEPNTEADMSYDECMDILLGGSI